MTDSTIDGKFLTFYDGWPDSKVLYAIPTDGFNGSDHHNVATAKYPLGTKITIYNTNSLSKGRPGWVTFMYAQAGSEDGTTAIAAKSLCVPQNYATSDTAHIYRLTNAADAPAAVATGTPLVAIAIGAMTASYYGWFQVAGTPAADLVTSGTTYCLDTTFKTDGSVTTGPIMVEGSASGDIKLSIWQTLTSLAVKAYCGHSQYTDT